ncbi:MAG: hypothetical protein IPG67_08085 [Acidobacteria bacterium]|nr:hypothetical protein [Acidobacteriota bacterium]
MAQRFLRISAFMASEFDKLKREIDKGSRVISLSGLTSVAAKAFVLTRLRAETGKVFAVVTESNTELESWEADLDLFQSNIPNL